MKSQIYDNLPYDLTKETDLFGTQFKAETIPSILDSNIEYSDSNNFISLYGSWGSGKTSMMRYIGSNTKKYNTVFFEAWKYENDSNLALSLLECNRQVVLNTFC
ncbi:P-loop NTPase fold protein [Gracilibacillus sp. S3-1-1]|uniref:P-loop NTPase fold protein n=1 Tax=Gracilibacillus pellucidus TaxID=3095368 RepID=A0ACC6M1L1_9BACI|nr:P-loop NTPase fold protein [Gracilibacillus sp. S3-1-1]MDX8044768.1 P-loop NTPase fold protein [Gracilibacillus sp. S3-1-1]